MAAPAFRTPAAYLHGDAAVVVVPARVAVWLERHADLRALRTRHRGTDPEIDAVLIALATAATVWRGRHVGGTPVAAGPEPAAPCPLSAAQAGEALGLTSRAVRKAAAEGRLAASKQAGAWRIEREDLEHYRAARAA